MAMWDKVYKFMMEYTCELAEALFLNGEHEQAWKNNEMCINKAVSIQDQFRPTFLKLKIIAAESKLEEVVLLGWEYLRAMGHVNENSLTQQYINSIWLLLHI